MSGEKKSSDFDRERRRFSVSANRGLAQARVRYVETGGAAVDTEECTFCQALPMADDVSSGKSPDQADCQVSAKPDVEAMKKGGAQGQEQDQE